MERIVFKFISSNEDSLVGIYEGNAYTKNYTKLYYFKGKLRLTVANDYGEHIADLIERMVIAAQEMGYDKQSVVLTVNTDVGDLCVWVRDGSWRITDGSKTLDNGEGFDMLLSLAVWEAYCDCKLKGNLS